MARPIDYVEAFTATPGPFCDLIEAIVFATGLVPRRTLQFKELEPVRRLLALSRAEQHDALLAVFHEIGLFRDRVLKDREHVNDRAVREVLIPLFTCASCLLKRDHKLTQDDWVTILRDVGKFPFISLGLSHAYVNPLLSSIERDAKKWESIPKPLEAAIKRVASAIGRASSNAPQRKASERLLTILRRFDAKKNVASKSAASALPATQQEVRMVPSPPIESTVPPVAAFLLDNYITTLAQKPLMVLRPGDEPRPTTLDDILATDSDTLREVLREALVMLAWLRDPKHPPPPPRWDKWHFECVPHHVIESLCVAILHRQPPLDDDLLVLVCNAALAKPGKYMWERGIMPVAAIIEKRCEGSVAPPSIRECAVRAARVLQARGIPGEQNLAQQLLSVSTTGVLASVRNAALMTTPISLVPDSPDVREKIAIILVQLQEQSHLPEYRYGTGFMECPASASLRSLPTTHFDELVRQSIARSDDIEASFAAAKSMKYYDTPSANERNALIAAIASYSTAVVVDRPHTIDYLCQWLITTRYYSFALADLETWLLVAIERQAKMERLTPHMREWASNARLRWSRQPKHYATRLRRIRRLLAEEIIIDLDPGEPWAAQALADVNASSPAARATWTHLIDHCMGTSTSAPSAKWSARASELVKAIGKREFEETLLRWLPLVNAPRTTSIGVGYMEMPVGSMMLLDRSMCTLRGLVWALSLAPTPTNTPDIARALGHLVISAYRKVPERGPRAVLVGNAAIHALGQMKGQDALGQLAMLRVKVKFGTGQKMLEKALVAAATRAGLPRDEIEELAVPSYGMTDVGVRREEIGAYLAELRIGPGGSLDLTFTKQDADAKGKPPKVQKSVPASIKADHADDLKELKAASKDIAAMLPAQRDRIDALFVENRTWALEPWRERYLDHPLVGTIARRLIWTFAPPSTAKDAAHSHATWLESAGSLVTVDGAPFVPPDGATVSLWHPINHSTDDIVAWRRFFEDRQIRQPFKQAHREVYILTDAERNTGTYSNRYAAHILRQHQFNALCAARQWKNKLRLMVDAEYPPASRHLAAFGLRAEFWIEGAGDDYGVHTNEAGTFHFLATDQVRFYHENAAQGTSHASGGVPVIRDTVEQNNPNNEPLALDQIPALAFSEIMRDVDLFVGVASIGNNPNWADGGPTNEHREYWWQFSFGEMSESGKARRDILSRIVPRLKIAPVCTLADQFLIVKGKIRTYKIHLGSGNILMEPNDQYLCIVPSSRDETLGGASGGPGVFLPFEGDRTLSIILSKAFMLAADDTIIDPSIRSQIGRK